MKKLLILTVLMICISQFCLTGCGSKNILQPQESASASAKESPFATQTRTASAEAQKTIAPAQTLWKSLPRIDGSTATIPLSEGIAQVLLGVKPEDAAKIIHHNTTHDAYVNLIEGNADIIFVTEPSKEELQLAKDKGIQLEVTPVVREGFVFLVNKDNPVSNLTVEQIQGIYRNKITNWRDAGGSDAPIRAYQRPINSGSQTLMLSLVMKDKTIAEPLTELVESSMGGLIEAVAAFDTGEKALGYSVYYYATDMYALEGAKLLSVNGVFPDKKSISSQRYPLVSAYYSVIKSAEAKDSPARKLLAWVLSPEGQNTADVCGYVPLKMQ